MMLALAIMAISRSVEANLLPSMRLDWIFWLKHGVDFILSSQIGLLSHIMAS